KAAAGFGGARHHYLVKTLGQASNLQLQIILIGPEPGQGAIGFEFTANGVGGNAGLIGVVSHRLNAQLNVGDGVVVVGAITGAQDIVIIGTGELIHYQAIVHFEASLLGQLNIGNHANTYNHQIGRDNLTVGSGDGFNLVLAINRLYSGIGEDFNPFLTVDPAVERRDFRGGNTLEHAGQGFQYSNVHIEAAQRCCGLKANVAAADDNGFLGMAEVFADMVYIIEVAQIENAGQVVTGNGDFADLGASSEHQLGVGDIGLIVEVYFFVGTIHGSDSGAEDDFNIRTLIKSRRSNHDLVENLFAGEVRLGQWRPVIGQKGIGTDDG